jgi:predicted short-subunit dehydrogenase-like oxidoreductase (DUF2520 family)
MQKSSKPNLPRVTLIGYGNWGQALASVLMAAEVPIAEIIVKAEANRALRAGRKSMRGACQTTLKNARLDADIFWICTQDGNIPETARQLTAALRQKSPQKPLVIFHSSGVLPSTVLAKLQGTGAWVAAVHPLMTFPRRPKSTEAPASLRGVPFALEGDARACRIARRLIRALGGVAFNLSVEQKVLYHLFGTFASPLLTALLTAVEQVGMAAGFTPRQARQRMRPIAERTLANFFADGPNHVFSGPFARGDAATIRRHLQALRPHPQLAELYHELGRFSLQALPVKNPMALQQALDGPTAKIRNNSASGSSRRASTA